MIKIKNKNPIIMLGGSESEARIAKQYFLTSSFENDFLTFTSSYELISYLDKTTAEGPCLPSLIILDVTTADESMHHSLKDMRSHPDLQKIPVICMFSHTDNIHSTGKMIIPGVARYQIKPHSRTEFLKFYLSLFPFNVLIVDDDEDFLEMMSEKVSQMGDNPITASNADAALQIFGKNAPDLILSDYSMPGMNGIDFLHEISNRQQVPAFLISGLIDGASKPKAALNYPEDLFRKPVEFETMYQIATASTLDYKVIQKIRKKH